MQIRSKLNLIRAITKTAITLTLGSIICAEELKHMEPMQMVEKISWLGQATVKINAINAANSQPLILYIDPYKIKQADSADIILITHKHQDHLSIPDIEKILSERSTIIAPSNCIGAFSKNWKARIIPVTPGMTETVEGITIQAVPAYNIKKKENHPKSNNWVGYIVTIQGVRIYHTGDTERIPEMKEIVCDIVMVPLGQTYTMNSIEEAAQVTLDVKATIAIPIHYG
ncbi:MAG: MBL fold metallo-hydrolase, partial [Chitinivibrionales bacterium]|nr:MBL fold metallo-hydrolase [Chitinivibrionales bacterium]